MLLNDFDHTMIATTSRNMDGTHPGDSASGVIQSEVSRITFQNTRKHIRMGIRLVKYGFDVVSLW